MVLARFLVCVDVIWCVRGLVCRHLRFVSDPEIPKCGEYVLRVSVSPRVLVSKSALMLQVLFIFGAGRQDRVEVP